MFGSRRQEPRARPQHPAGELSAGLSLVASVLRGHAQGERDEKREQALDGRRQPLD